MSAAGNPVVYVFFIGLIQKIKSTKTRVPVKLNQGFCLCCRNPGERIMVLPAGMAGKGVPLVVTAKRTV